MTNPNKAWEQWRAVVTEHGEESRQAKLAEARYERAMAVQKAAIIAAGAAAKPIRC